MKNLLEKSEVEKYRSSHGVYYVGPNVYGYLEVDILEFLNGLPLCDLVLAYVAGFRPTLVRISKDELTTDSQPGRVTIMVSADDKIIKISQTITVDFVSGWELDKALNLLREADSFVRSR